MNKPIHYADDLSPEVLANLREIAKGGVHVGVGGKLLLALLAIADRRAALEIERAQHVETIKAATESYRKLWADILILKARAEQAEAKVCNAHACFVAADYEGLGQLLYDSKDERLVDVVSRRLLHAVRPHKNLSEHTLEPGCPLCENTARTVS